MNLKSFEEEAAELRKIAEQKAARKPGKPRRILLLLILAGLSYGAYRLWGTSFKPQAADVPQADAGGGGGRGRGGRGGGGGRGVGPRGAAVVTMAARKMDMPVYLRGLGSVAASTTVTVRSRVDGQLVRAAFREGQFVNKGDLLAEIDRRPFEVQLAQAQAQLQRDQAQLKDAEVKLERDHLLDSKGLIAKQDLDSQGAQVGQFQGSINADEAQIASANLNLTYSRITAPISGQVGLRLVDEGNIVRAADPGGLVVITQLQPISVLFSIPEANLGAVLKKIRAGQQLRVEAWDHDDSKKIADGTLITADNQIDQSTGTSRLKAIFGNVKRLIGVLKGAIVVPAATVQRGSQGMFVYVVDDKQTAQLRPVTIQYTEGSDVSISSGLEAGEMVVLEGMDKVQDGARVDVQTPGQTDSAGAGGSGGGGRGGGGGGRGKGRRN